MGAENVTPSGACNIEKKCPVSYVRQCVVICLGALATVAGAFISPNTASPAIRGVIALILQDWQDTGVLALIINQCLAFVAGVISLHKRRWSTLLFALPAAVFVALRTASSSDTHTLLGVEVILYLSYWSLTWLGICAGGIAKLALRRMYASGSTHVDVSNVR